MSRAAELLQPHLSAYWLRPESAIWDAIAASHLEPRLRDRKNLVEVGIGNGFFSFLMLGGRFTDHFDWFRSVKAERAGGADMFDYDAGFDISTTIVTKPHTRIGVAVDHKATLLAQAGRLSFIDRLLEHDANEPLPADVAFEHAYSNILYWLNDPLGVMHRVGERLPQGGTFVAVFPSSRFFEACRSYREKDPLSIMINRGRASHIMWQMDEPEFRREVDRRQTFEVVEFSRYLSPLVLKIWDIGLRPMSVPLIRMANALSERDRLEIKAEWCETASRLAGPVLEHEAEYGARDGGFNLVVLSRR